MMAARRRTRRSRTTRPSSIVLKEPYGLVVDMARQDRDPMSATSCARRKPRPTRTSRSPNPSDPVPSPTTRTPTSQGQRYVYDRNPNYVPRSEPAVGMAGGKVVNVDRVIYENIADEADRARRDLQAGEIDFFEIPPSTCSTRSPERTGHQGRGAQQAGPTRHHAASTGCYPPFNNVDARKAMLYLIHQDEFMKATFGDQKYYKSAPRCSPAARRWRTTRTPTGSRSGQNIAKAKELFKKSGYDGRPVVVLQATNIDYMNNSADLMAQWMRKAGFNVSLQASDWGGRDHAPRRQGAAGPGRLEHLLHLGLGRRLGRQSDRLRRPCRPTARRAGSAGRPTRSTRTARQMGGRGR